MRKSIPITLGIMSISSFFFVGFRTETDGIFRLTTLFFSSRTWSSTSFVISLRNLCPAKLMLVNCLAVLKFFIGIFNSLESFGERANQGLPVSINAFIGIAFVCGIPLMVKLR